MDWLNWLDVRAKVGGNQNSFPKVGGKVHTDVDNVRVVGSVMATQQGITGTTSIGETTRIHIN